MRTIYDLEINEIMSLFHSNDVKDIPKELREYFMKYIIKIVIYATVKSTIDIELCKAMLKIGDLK